MWTWRFWRQGMEPNTAKSASAPFKGLLTTIMVLWLQNSGVPGICGAGCARTPGQRVGGGAGRHRPPRSRPFNPSRGGGKSWTRNSEYISVPDAESVILLDIEALIQSWAPGRTQGPHLQDPSPTFAARKGPELIKERHSQRRRQYRSSWRPVLPRANYDVFDFPTLHSGPRQPARTGGLEPETQRGAGRSERGYPDDGRGLYAHERGQGQAKMQLPEAFPVPNRRCPRTYLSWAAALSGLTAANWRRPRPVINAVLVEKEKELGGFQKGVRQRRVSFSVQGSPGQPPAQA